MKLIIAFALSLLFLACASNKSAPEEVTSRPAPEHLSKGRKLLEKEKFEEALAEFASVLKNQTTTPEVPLAIYYSGVAQQGLGKCPEAIEKFRKYTSGIANSDVNLVPQAFYRLGLCYEALGDKGGAIAAFIDSLNRIASTQTPLRAELEARLAGLYAQMGNEQDAQRLYDAAERDLMAMRRLHPSNELPPWLASTLFNMGKMSTKPLVNEDFEGSIRSFERAQIWLLKVARLNDKKWSELAANEIVKMYSDAWKMIDSVPLRDDTDKVLALKDQQDRRINMGVALYGLISRLKLERGYDFSVENKFERQVFESLADVDSHLEMLLKSRPVEQSLTPAAQEREGLKRSGNVIDVPSRKKGRKK